MIYVNGGSINCTTVPGSQNSFQLRSGRVPRPPAAPDRQSTCWHDTQSAPIEEEHAPPIGSPVSRDVCQLSYFVALYAIIQFQTIAITSHFHLISLQKPPETIKLELKLPSVSVLPFNKNMWKCFPQSSFVLQRTSSMGLVGC